MEPLTESRAAKPLGHAPNFRKELLGLVVTLPCGNSEHVPGFALGSDFFGDLAVGVLFQFAGVGVELADAFG